MIYFANKPSNKHIGWFIVQDWNKMTQLNFLRIWYKFRSFSFQWSTCSTLISCKSIIKLTELQSFSGDNLRSPWDPQHQPHCILRRHQLLLAPIKCGGSNVKAQRLQPVKSWGLLMMQLNCHLLLTNGFWWNLTVWWDRWKPEQVKLDPSVGLMGKSRLFQKAICHSWRKESRNWAYEAVRCFCYYN